MYSCDFFPIFVSGRYLISLHMETNNKELYTAPQAEVLELCNEGIICLSPGKYPQWGEENI